MWLFKLFHKMFYHPSKVIISYYWILLILFAFHIIELNARTLCQIDDDYWIKIIKIHCKASSVNGRQHSVQKWLNVPNIKARAISLPNKPLLPSCKTYSGNSGDGPKTLTAETISRRTFSSYYKALRTSNAMSHKLIGHFFF